MTTRILALTLTIMAVAASVASAQQAPAKPPLKPSPYLELKDAKLWRVLVRAEVAPDRGFRVHNRVHFDREPEIPRVVGEPCYEGYRRAQVFDEGRILWPIVLESSSARFAGDPLTRDLAFDTWYGGFRMFPPQTLLEGDQPGYAELLSDMGQAVTAIDSNYFAERERPGYLAIEAQWHTYAAEVVFDEERARRVPWPAGAWPEEARAVMEPQLGIEFGAEGPYPTRAVNAFLDEATEGQPTDSVPPVVLAKWLAAKLFDRVQVTAIPALVRGDLARRQRDNIQEANRAGTADGVVRPLSSAAGVSNAISSFFPRGSEQTLTSGTGSSLDLASTLVALYRTAGLPARLVVVYDELEASPELDGQPFDNARTDASAIRYLVEFALYDEADNSLGWVPVDIEELDRRHSRIPDGFMDRPQEYFGSSRDFRYLVPLGFGLHPRLVGLPGTLEPALWAWLFDPNVLGESRACHGMAVSVLSPTVDSSGEFIRDPRAEKQRRTRP